MESWLPCPPWGVRSPRWACVLTQGRCHHQIQVTVENHHPAKGSRASPSLSAWRPRLPPTWGGFLRPPRTCLLHIHRVGGTSLWRHCGGRDRVWGKKCWAGGQGPTHPSWPVSWEQEPRSSWLSWVEQGPFTQGGTEAKRSPGVGQSWCAGRPCSLGPGTLSVPGWRAPPLPAPGRPPGARPTLRAGGSGIRSVQSLSHVRLFATPWSAARQASLSIRE